MKILFIFILLIATGCSANEKETDPLPAPTPELASVAVVGQINLDKYTLYSRKNDYALSLYEPAEGCFLGAYILSNKKINFDMAEFDKLTGKSHSLFMYNMKLGEPFPTNWILSCIAQMKTPYIVVMPPNDYNPFDESLLIHAAKEFGEFYIPVFVDFYPVSREKKYNAAQYKAFYQKARDIFADYASNTAFVWSISGKDVLDTQAYYPGDQAADWVGLSLYRTLDTTGGDLEESIYGASVFNEIDYFYYLFQKTKPIMLSQMAVSHYNSKDHAYRSKEAAAELTGIYDTVIRDYPRIKGIVYMDFNGFELSPQKANLDNFSVTDEDILREAYGRAIGDERFLSRLDMTETAGKKSQLIRSPFPAVKWEDTFYISEKTLTYDLQLSDLSPYPEKIIDGSRYFDILSGKEPTIEEDAGKIIIGD